MAVIVTSLGTLTTLVSLGQTAADPAVEQIDIHNPASESDVAVKEELAEPKPDTPRILGWKEWVWVINPKMLLRAKLDTGARTCSIHAINIETLEIDGKKWVKFTICDPENENGVRHRHKAPVLRIAKVKNDSGSLDARYVVPLVFQIGDQKMEAEFTLNDRSHMICEVLIGRNALKQIGAVDASRTDLLGKPGKPAQQKPTPPKAVPVKE